MNSWPHFFICDKGLLAGHRKYTGLALPLLYLERYRAIHARICTGRCEVKVRTVTIAVEHRSMHSFQDNNSIALTKNEFT